MSTVGYINHFSRRSLQRTNTASPLIVMGQHSRVSNRRTSTIIDSQRDLRPQTVGNSDNKESVNKTGKIMPRRSSSRALVRVKSLKSSDMLINAAKLIPQPRKLEKKQIKLLDMSDELDLSRIDANCPFEKSNHNYDEAFVCILSALDKNI